MYQGHFRLNGQPFNNTPDTALFFAGSNRGAVLDALSYAIGNGEAIIKVVGEVGSGKTMLCRMLETKLSPSTELVYLANPSLAPDTILHAIAVELKLPLTPATNKFEVLQMLQTLLLRKHAENQKVVVLIEEAQCMPLATLEEIRLLSNIETHKHKLIQVVLFGQPELDEKLAASELRQLTERISQAFYLTPFSAKDIRDYVNFRLAKKGVNGMMPFSAQAVRSLARYSKGLVRRVNFLADKTMLAAYSENAVEILPRHVRRAARDCEFSRRENATRFNLISGGAVGLLFLSAALAIAGTKTTRHDPASTAVTVNSEPHSSTPIEISEVFKATATSSSRPQRDNRATEAGAPVDIPKRHVISAFNNVPSIESVLDNPIVEARLSATNAWLDLAKKDKYTIQIMTSFVDKPNEIRGLQQLFQKDDVKDLVEKLYVYQGIMNAKRVFVLAFNEFPNYHAARDAIGTMPSELRRFQPLVRTIASLRNEIDSD